ncbi:MAG TPA: hypothetical protein VFZ23_09195 [Pyrinomonadaceae bacterium]
MQKRGQIVLGLGSAAVMVFVVWVLQSDPDSTVSRYVFDRAWTSLLFALLMLGSVGLLLTLLAGLIRREDSANAVGRWKKIRSKGRTAYIRWFTLFSSAPLLVSFAIVFVYQLTSKDGDLRFLLALPAVALVFVVAVILVASRNWSENEAQYREPHTDSDDAAEGGVG